MSALSSLSNPRYSPLFENIRRPFSIVIAKRALGTTIPWDTITDDADKYLLDFIELIDMLEKCKESPSLEDFSALIKSDDGLCVVNAWLTDTYLKAMRLKGSRKMERAYAVGSPLYQLAEMRAEEEAARQSVPTLWPWVDKMYWSGLKQKDWDAKDKAIVADEVGDVSLEISDYTLPSPLVALPAERTAREQCLSFSTDMEIYKDSFHDDAKESTVELESEIMDIEGLEKQTNSDSYTIKRAINEANSTSSVSFETSSSSLSSNTCEDIPEVQDSPIRSERELSMHPAYRTFEDFGAPVSTQYLNGQAVMGPLNYSLRMHRTQRSYPRKRC